MCVYIYIYIVISIVISIKLFEISENVSKPAPSSPTIVENEPMEVMDDQNNTNNGIK